MTVYKASISPDEYAENPLSWVDKGIVFACEHGRYDLGNMRMSEFLDSVGYDGDMYDLAAVIDYLKPMGWVDTLSLTDHSYLSVYRGRPNDCWDAGYIGVVFVPNEVKVRYPSIEGYIDSMLESYEAYLNGSVFAFVIQRYTSEGMEFVDACGGYYDYNDMKREIKETIDSFGDCTGIEWNE